MGNNEKYIEICKEGYTFTVKLTYHKAVDSWGENVKVEVYEKHTPATTLFKKIQNFFSIIRYAEGTWWAQTDRDSLKEFIDSKCRGAIEDINKMDFGLRSWETIEKEFNEVEINEDIENKTSKK